MNIRTYRGTRTKTPGSAETSVTVDGKPLNPRLDLWNHSPTGFEWGYPGSGPAQLALALLADHFGSYLEPKERADELAVKYHQDFKREIVAALDEAGWSITGEQIARALTAIQAQ